MYCFIQSCFNPWRTGFTVNPCTDHYLSHRIESNDVKEVERPSLRN